MVENSKAKKIIFIIIIQLLIAAIHVFRVGQLFDGFLYTLYYSYFSDLILPFGVYFLLCANEFQLPFLRHWGVKALIVFSMATAAEICQFFDLEVLGNTFDPIDIVMYLAGALMAALLDTRVFPRIFKFWVFS